MSPIKPSDKAKAVEMDSMWIVYLELATKYKACMLASGTPDIPVPDSIKEFLAIAANNPSSNWYSPPRGSPKLLAALLKYYAPCFNGNLHSTSQLQVTIGAYQAIHFTFQAFIEEGDEVICFQPFFDCYKMNALVSNSKLVLVQLQQNETKWVLRKDDLLEALSPKTKIILLNTPHNPTGKVFSREELNMIAEISKERNLLVLSDEVYEDYTFEPNKHIRIANLPGMWERTITVGSGGKMFGVTGWRLGWAIGPTALITRLYHICICNHYCAPTPLQEALGAALEQETLGKNSIINAHLKLYYNNYKLLSDAFTRKGFRVIPSQGSYFMIVDFVDLVPKFMKWINEDDELKDSTENLDVRVCKMLTKTFRISCLPLTLFYGDDRCYHANTLSQDLKHMTLLRVTFAKSESTIDAALELIDNLQF